MKTFHRTASADAVPRLSIPCADPSDALAKVGALIRMARSSLSVPGATEGVALLLDLAGEGVALAQQHIQSGIPAVVLQDAHGAMPRSPGEIDHRLAWNGLTQLDRAVHLAECKVEYESRYPETKAGVAGGLVRQGVTVDVPSFATFAAAQMGVTERQIARLVEIGKGLCPAVRARLSGTWIARNLKQLAALARVPAARQDAVVDLLLDEAKGINTVAAALRHLDGGEG